MRVLIDTNVLFSAILFPKGEASKALCLCIEKHRIVIASYVIEELKKAV
jgi:predicted nucleic acid-binding protein